MNTTSESDSSPAGTVQDASAAEASADVSPVVPDEAAAAADVADGLWHDLDPRWVVVARIRGAISAAVMSLGLLLPAGGVAIGSGRLAVAAVSMGVWAAAAAFLASRAIVWPPVSFRHQTYRLHPQGIDIRRGVFWRTTISVPRSRVQHTDVAQGPLERSYGLGRLVVYTAGSSHARVSLEGLAHTRALRIRDYLLPGEGSDAV